MEKLFCPICEREFTDQDIVYCPYDGVKLILRSKDKFSGQILDRRYEILFRIGRGGMGAVYKARQINTGKSVAIKMISVSLLNDEETIKRFKREINLQLKLSHPNIVSLVDFSKTPDGSYYFVMEFLEGKSLKQIVEEKGALPLKYFYELALQMCDAIEYAHNQGVVHRDLKSENIIVIPLAHQHIVKILDFGIAKAFEKEKEKKDKLDLTQVGEVLGTPAYISPEQAKGEVDKISYRSDIYSLGVIFYYMLSGQLPFKSNTPWGFFHKHIYETPPSLLSVTSNKIPEGLNSIVMKCLEKRPEDRFSSVKEIKEELQKELKYIMYDEKYEETEGDINNVSSLEDEETTIDTFVTTRNKWPIILLSFLSVLLVIGGIFWWENRNTFVSKGQGKREIMASSPVSFQKEKVIPLLNKAKELYKKGILIKENSPGDDAYTYFKKVLAIDSNNKEALDGIRHIKDDLLYKYDILFKEKKFAEAMEGYRKVATYFPQDPDIKSKIARVEVAFLLLRARNLKIEGKLSEAVDLLKEIKQKDPHNKEAEKLLLEIQELFKKRIERAIFKKEFQKAVHILKEVDRIFPGKFKKTASRLKIEKIFFDAEKAIREKDYLGAAKFYKEVLAFDPQNKRAIEGLAKILLELKKEGDEAFRNKEYEKAKKIYKQALGIDKDSVEIKEKLRVTTEKIKENKPKEPDTQKELEEEKFDTRPIIIKGKSSTSKSKKVARAEKSPSIEFKKVRFFEGSILNIPGKDERSYAFGFPQSKVRGIYTEIVCKNLYNRRDHFHKVKVEYYSPDNSLLWAMEKNWKIEAGWEASYRVLGYGWDIPGHWKPGNYGVKIYIDGKEIASSIFAIYLDRVQASTRELRFLSLRFFEADRSKLPEKNEREYRRKFDSHSARAIWYELEFENLLYGIRDQKHELIVRYYYPGSRFRWLKRRNYIDIRKKMVVKSFWKTSIHVGGYGWNFLGHWSPGKYRVEVYIDGKKVTKGEFVID